MIIHKKAKFGEKTFIRIDRARNSYSSIPKGSSWVFPKDGYKLVVIEDTKLKEWNMLFRYQDILVIKIRH